MSKRTLSEAVPEAVHEIGPALCRLVPADRDAHSLFLGDQHGETLCPRQGGIEDIPLEHDIVVGEHEHNDRRPL